MTEQNEPGREAAEQKVSARMTATEILAKYKQGERNFSGLDLAGADFSFADLSNVNFSGSNLKNADFSFANLEGDNFTGADLTNANLESANLNNAELTNANLGDVNFDNVAHMKDAFMRVGDAVFYISDED